MPKKTKGSKYAAKLRELGFRPFTEIMSQKERSAAESIGENLLGFNLSKVTRQERRRMAALKLLPAFCPTDTGTYAVDETGIEWGSDEEIDLAAFGFSNLAEGIKKQVHSTQGKLN